MFDESQEVLCILLIIFFWCLSLAMPFFAIIAVIVVLYVSFGGPYDDDTESSDRP